MQRFIKLNEAQNAEFMDYIKEQRAKIILNPKDTFTQAIKEYSTSKISLNNISNTIKELRELSYEIFLEQENNFNAVILENISNKLDMPKKLLNTTAKELFKSLQDNPNNYKKDFAKYFGKYAGSISPYIYSLCLSNTQSRRSRAGKTFEQIIYYLYTHFNFSFNSQASIGKLAFSKLRLGKVVDSILPSIDAFKKFRNKTIVGSMKTTLRERWQEVVEEIGRSNLPNIYLLTCDDDISKNKIEQMREHNIILVVYDEAKDKLKDFDSVISFEYYFSVEIPNIMEYWRGKDY